MALPSTGPVVAADGSRWDAPVGGVAVGDVPKGYVLFWRVPREAAPYWGALKRGVPIPTGVAPWDVVQQWNVSGGGGLARGAPAGGAPPGNVPRVAISGCVPAWALSSPRVPAWALSSLRVRRPDTQTRTPPAPVPARSRSMSSESAISKVVLPVPSWHRRVELWVDEQARNIGL